MGFFDGQKRELDNSILELKKQIAELKLNREAAERRLELADEAVKLKEQIETLKIEKGRITEDNAREKREVTHMVGLERKRQEFEAEQAKKSVETARAEAILTVREENLSQEREAFEAHMKFQNDRFQSEVGYLKELMGQILDRLPTVNVDRQIRETTKRTAKADD